MESWRKVWQDGIAPLLSFAGLVALAKALRDDDPRLIQGATTYPDPLIANQDLPVEASDAIGFCGWQGDGLELVGEVEEYFARTCSEIDQRLGEPAGCRWFLNWYDEMARDDMRRELLAEVKLAMGKIDKAAADIALEA